MSLTGRKALPKAPKHSGVALEHRDSPGNCSSVCMCKNSSFLVLFEAATEFTGDRVVLSPNCYGVPGAASKFHSASVLVGIFTGLSNLMLETVQSGVQLSVKGVCWTHYR